MESTIASISRLGDKSDHGGEIITATSGASISGVVVARTGDIHRCPIHGDTPITAFSRAYDEERSIAHVGAKAGCGAIITTGDDEVRLPLQEV
jgi:uncharacterized Zn-binding protein involved in type VI secretion